MESRASMKTKLLKEIKEGFDFAMQDAINKGLIKALAIRQTG